MAQAVLRRPSTTCSRRRGVGVFGRRADIYFWTIFAAALIAVVSAHPSGTWALYAGIGLGAASVGWILLPDAVMPHQVFKWQLASPVALGQTGELDDLFRRPRFQAARHCHRARARPPWIMQPVKA